MQDIKDIQRTNNLVTSYSEAEEQFTVTRNGAGKPTFIRGKRGRWVTQEATFNYDQSGNFTGLSKEIDTAMLTVLVSEANGSTGGGGASSTESLSDPRTVTADDDQKQFTCITALTVTCPNGLSPKPSTIFFPPATGNLTLTPAGGATLNGSASPITRAFTGTNKLGVALIPNPYDVNDYTVSGS